MRRRRLQGNASALGADNDSDFAFVVELDQFRRQQQRLPVRCERGFSPQEQARLCDWRLVSLSLIFIVTFRIVHPDTNDLAGLVDGKLEAVIVRSEIRTVSLGEVGRHVQLAGRQQAPDVRYAGHAGPQIDNAAIPKGAKTCGSRSEIA
jgi:hypothetical protein